MVFAFRQLDRWPLDLDVGAPIGNTARQDKIWIVEFAQPTQNEIHCLAFHSSAYLVQGVDHEHFGVTKQGPGVVPVDELFSAAERMTRGIGEPFEQMCFAHARFAKDHQRLCFVAQFGLRQHRGMPCGRFRFSA